MKLSIIYTQESVLLSKKRYASWRDIQDEYETYHASLGPWEVEEVIDYLATEYSALEPPAPQQVSAFLSGTEEAIALLFRG